MVCLVLCCCLWCLWLCLLVFGSACLSDRHSCGGVGRLVKSLSSHSRTPLLLQPGELTELRRTYDVHQQLFQAALLWQGWLAWTHWTHPSFSFHPYTGSSAGAHLTIGTSLFTVCGSMVTGGNVSGGSARFVVGSRQVLVIANACTTHRVRSCALQGSHLPALQMTLGNWQSR